MDSFKSFIKGISGVRFLLFHLGYSDVLRNFQQRYCPCFSLILNVTRIRRLKLPPKIFFLKFSVFSSCLLVDHSVLYLQNIFTATVEVSSTNVK